MKWRIPLLALVFVPVLMGASECEVGSGSNLRQAEVVENRGDPDGNGYSLLIVKYPNRAANSELAVRVEHAGECTPGVWYPECRPDM